MAASFRALKAAEIELVVAMMARLYAQGADPFDAERARRTTATLLNEPEWGGTWLISLDGEVAGYLVVVAGYSLEFGGRFGLLDELYLEERARGRGVGKEALAFAEERCRERGWQAVRLEVGQGNGRAQAVYKAAGFQLHDRFLMTKWAS